MNWMYLNNQFDNVTKNSNLQMVIITNDHFAKLTEQQADPDVANLLALTTPLHDAFLDAYNTSKSSIAFRKGATLGVTQKLELLRSTKLRNWDAKVQSFFLSGSPEYTVVFPNGLTAFHTSTIDQTVSMLDALAERMDGFPDLVDVKAEVETFHTELKDLRDLQQGKEQLVGQASTDLETARLNLAIRMYANLGSLMNKFAAAPENIANYWEVQLLQRGNSSSNDGETEEFTGTVPPSSTVNVTNTIADDASIVISNTGTVALVVCAAPDEVTACGVDSLTLNPGEVYTGTGADFNAAGTHLNITNNSPDTDGSYSVEIQS